MIKTNNIQIRDPFVLKENGKYYLYGSTDKDIWRNNPGTGFDVYVGDDLENWDGPYHAFRPPLGFWGTINFWAPEVHKYRGLYYMFATFWSESVMRGTAILKSDNPLGPFNEWSDGAVTPKDCMCLDGTLYVDDNSQPWLIFCHEWVQICDGTVCAVKLTGDLKMSEGDPIVLFKSSDAVWSKETESKSNNIKGFVTDGCYLYKMKNGKLLLLWSCIGEKGYCIGYATSESANINGEWTQCEQPIFKKDGGHGMIFTSYENRLLLAIHTPNDTPNERAVFYELIETSNGLILIC